MNKVIINLCMLPLTVKDWICSEVGGINIVIEESYRDLYQNA